MLEIGKLEAHGDLIGYLAASLVFTTFLMRTMLLLRIMALVSNAAFLTYALAANLMPILVLHTLLVPINVYRIWQIIRGSPKAGQENVETRALASPTAPSWRSRRSGVPRRTPPVSYQRDLRRHRH